MTEAPDRTTPGTLIAGKYRVERVLGEGGMGVVLEATHLVLGQRVAVKLLRAEIARDTDTNVRFLREARIAAQLPPEHIARVTDIGETEEGEPYLVMELLTGRDLAAELHVRGPLPVSEAIDIILQACEGLAEAHAVGLVHRDLKPANIFLASRRGRGEAPVVKILDFGLSKSFDVQGAAALTQTETNFGTPAYMSPEQIRSAKYVEPRSDQHALAMILYELLTGQLPYDAESLTGLAVVIATAPPPSARKVRPEVPAGLDAAIRRGLGKQLSDRFPTLIEFAEALAPFGGPQAAARAARVSAILEPKLPEVKTIPNPPRLSLPAADDPAKAHLDTHSATTSDPQYAGGIRKKPVLLAMAGGAMVMAAILFLIMLGDPPAEAPQGTPGPEPTTEPAPVTPPAPEPSVAPPPSAVPEAPTAAPSATAAPTSSAKTKRPARPSGTARPPATATGKPSDQSPRDVFGGPR
jgi:serine/threonine-protein kinase